MSKIRRFSAGVLRAIGRSIGRQPLRANFIQTTPAGLCANQEAPGQMCLCRAAALQHFSLISEAMLQSDSSKRAHATGNPGRGEGHHNLGER